MDVVRLIRKRAFKVSILNYSVVLSLAGRTGWGGYGGMNRNGGIQYIFSVMSSFLLQDDIYSIKRSYGLNILDIF